MEHAHKRQHRNATRTRHVRKTLHEHRTNSSRCKHLNQNESFSRKMNRFREMRRLLIPFLFPLHTHTHFAHSRDSDLVSVRLRQKRMLKINIRASSTKNDGPSQLERKDRKSYDAKIFLSTHHGTGDDKTGWYIYLLFCSLFLITEIFKQNSRWLPQNIPVRVIDG